MFVVCQTNGNFQHQQPAPPPPLPRSMTTNDGKLVGKVREVFNAVAIVFDWDKLIVIAAAVAMLPIV